MLAAGWQDIADRASSARAAGSWLSCSSRRAAAVPAGANQTRMAPRTARLRVGREVAVHVVDLLLETLIQHLVRLVQHQRLDRARAQAAPLDHVEDAPGRAAHDVLPRLQQAHVLACPHACASAREPVSAA